MKAAIGVWERHLKTLRGSKSFQSAVKRRPLTETKRKRFVLAATSQLDTDVDNIAFESGTTVKQREKPIAGLITPAGGLYSPYAGRSYNRSRKAAPKRKKQTTRKRPRQPPVMGLADVARGIMRDLGLKP